MRVLTIALTMCVGWLGLGAAPAAADPVGPVCLQRTPFGETLELFVQAGGGSNFLLSGRLGPAATGVPVSGSGYIAGNSFRFSLSGHSPNSGGRLQITDGALDLTTLGGTGRCYTIGTPGGCGAGITVTYTSVPCS
jgi:hypothetical protein